MSVRQRDIWENWILWPFGFSLSLFLTHPLFFLCYFYSSLFQLLISEYIDIISGKESKEKEREREREREVAEDICFSLLEYLTLFTVDSSNSLLGHSISPSALLAIHLSNGASDWEKERERERGEERVRHAMESMGSEEFDGLLLRWSAIGECERGREKVISEIRALLKEKDKKWKRWYPGALVCIDAHTLPLPFR